MKTNKIKIQVSNYEDIKLVFDTKMLENKLI
jgi:hypothetical protein